VKRKEDLAMQWAYADSDEEGRRMKKCHGRCKHRQSKEKGEVVEGSKI
jgi:hypothetical protein